MSDTGTARVDTKFAQSLHMLVFIAETDSTASSQALATSVGTNPSHIRKLAALLKQAGLIDSTKGKAGFHLARPKASITLAEVYRAVYSDKTLLHIHNDPNPQCPIGRHIDSALAPTFVQVDRDLQRLLSGRTLADLIDNLYAAHANAGTN